VRLIEAVESDRSCESCGRRGRTLVAVDFGDGSEPFALCVSCANEAVECGCTLREIEEIG
jgi:hypothetical protein